MTEQLPEAVREFLSRIGKKGGRVRSERKAAAVRKNGKLGGKPRKAAATEQK